MILAMFERRGVDGPFGVHLRGSIARLSDETEWAWTTDARSNPKVIDIAEDGRRLLIEQDSDIKGKSGRIMKVIEFKDQSVEGLVTELRFSHSSSLADLDLRGVGVGQTLPHRFTRIAADPNGTLILISKKGVAWKIELQTISPTQGDFVMRSDPLFQGSGFMASFEPARHPNPGCTLGVATWPEGSRAFIDSRGLLHLQSSDDSTPEVTLVLSQHHISGWTSNNYWFGQVEYYSVPTVAPTLAAVEIQMTILKPFVERIVAMR
jgi:hypothetical protein